MEYLKYAGMCNISASTFFLVSPCFGLYQTLSIEPFLLVKQVVAFQEIEDDVPTLREALKQTRKERDALKQQLSEVPPNPPTHSAA